MKKRIALVILLLMTLPMVFGALAACTSYDETLVIYNWEDYIDLELLDEFKEYYKEETGKTLKIIYSTFDTNETMIANVTKGDAQVDLICPSEYAIQKLRDQGFLQPFNKDNMSNGDNLNPLFEEQLDEVFGDGDSGDRLFDYIVPYMWGTLGLLYNSDVISDEQIEEAGWGLLWNSTDIAGVNGTVLMKDSIRDVYVATLMYAKQLGLLAGQYLEMSAGELINTVNPELLAIAEDLLIKQRSKLKGYEVDLGKDDMIAGKANVNLAWSGDALYAMSEDEDGKLNYIVPGDEGNVWFDGWVLPKSAKNITAAEMFVDFMCEPDSAIRNMMFIGYTSAVDASVFEALPEESEDGSVYSKADVIAILEENEYGVFDEEGNVEATPWEDFFGNEIQYPTDFENMGVMKDFGAQNATIVAMWERVKSVSDNDHTIAFCLIVIFAVAAAIALGIVGYKLFDKKFPKRRYTDVESPGATI